MTNKPTSKPTSELPSKAPASFDVLTEAFRKAKEKGFTPRRRRRRQPRTNQERVTRDLTEMVEGGVFRGDLFMADIASMELHKAIRRWCKTDKASHD
jgi:hypothetical protein